MRKTKAESKRRKTTILKVIDITTLFFMESHYRSQRCIFALHMILESKDKNMPFESEDSI